MIPSVSQYAGQQLLTGAQAQVYANDFIEVHLNNIGGGKTYAQVSSARRWRCPANSAKHAALEARPHRPCSRAPRSVGCCLEAYGFSDDGRRSRDRGRSPRSSSPGSCFLLTLLGFLHYRKVDEKDELLGPSRRQRRRTTRSLRSSESTHPRSCRSPGETRGSVASRPRGQVRGEEREHPAPRVGRGGGVVDRRAVLAVEAVVGVGVADDLGRDRDARAAASRSCSTSSTGMPLSRSP